MAAPLKRTMPEFAQYEKLLWELIAKKYNLPSSLPEDVKMADKRACLTEAFHLMDGAGDDWNWEGVYRFPVKQIDCMSPQEARGEFLYRPLRARVNVRACVL